jgi:hypothetical protein
MGNFGLWVYGGCGADFRFTPDAWRLAPRAQVPLAESSSAPGQRACSAASALNGQVFLFGGFDGDADLADLWVYQWAGPSVKYLCCRTAREGNQVERPDRRGQEG